MNPETLPLNSREREYYERIECNRPIELSTGAIATLICLAVSAKWMLSLLKNSQ